MPTLNIMYMLRRLYKLRVVYQNSVEQSITTCLSVAAALNEKVGLLLHHVNASIYVSSGNTDGNA